VAGADIVVEIPELEPVEAAKPVTSHSSKLPLIMLGTGGGLVLASLAIGLHAKIRNDQPGNTQAQVDSIKTEANISNGFAIAGGVAVVVGIVGCLRKGHDPDPVALSPTFGTSSLGVAVGGSF
jgi:hypothetical protein